MAKTVEPDDEDFVIEDDECGACSGSGNCPDCSGDDDDCSECEGSGDCVECDGSGVAG